ncbi:peroxiredoxin [Candidatus Woesearchaeota archaeon CG10_big_fil_rev_8_21_14_0_10_30_7]|nr:MAG: peroxiredoxin [Candidatus Woesearchaeota archaeon CG10_big_fil_rev_8_21_14_0_10_30_7]
MAHKEGHNLGSAPDFDLPDQNENIVCLTDFRGKWLVLYFYPKDNTPGCTSEAITFCKYLPEYEKLNTCIVGVSADTQESHCNFIKKNKICITLLSDLNHKVSEKYKVWKAKNFYGVNTAGIERSTFIIDPKGTLVKEWRGVSVHGHVENVLKKLRELQK